MTSVNSIVQQLKDTLSYTTEFIPLHEPYFNGNEWNYVKECIDTGWVSSVGKFVDKFESDLAEYTGAKYAIATVNGTAALHISYLLADIGPGDEVLVPALTFVGTINPIHYCGAVPHFIDSEETYLGLDCVRLDEYLQQETYQKNNQCFNKITRRPIKAMCVMHTIGHPVDLDPLQELCQKYNIKLIEDAAEALGSVYKGTHVGHRGVAGALSFNGNKIITTGGGGAILTNDAALAKHAKHITTTAKLPHAWEFEHDYVGYNYRLPNLNAALGCAQLEQLPQFLQTKRILAGKYSVDFARMSGIRFVDEPRYARSNYWLNAVLLDKSLLDLRDELLNSLNKTGIMTRPLWNLQHTLSMYKDCPRMPLTVAENLQKRLVKIPSGVGIAEFLKNKTRA